MESQAIEWKETWRDDYMRTLCAFANASGGVLEIGRRDNGDVIGVAGITKLLGIYPTRSKAQWRLWLILLYVNLRVNYIL